MTDFTKGEWEVVISPNGEFVDVFGETGLPIVTIQLYKRNPETRKHNIANAHLISAAPDYYNAVEEYLNGSISLGKFEIELMRIQKKAKGEL